MLSHQKSLWLIIPLLLLSNACRQTNPTSSLNPSSKGERVIGKRGGEITVRVTALPKTFNALLIADEPSLLVCLYLLNSRLINFDLDGQRYVSGLAESWKLASDGRTVEITLRDELKFSDGQPLTADDVLFTLRALYDERTGATVLRDALMIDGKPIEAIAQDSRRLKLTFPKAVAAPESYLVNLPILPRHKLENDFNQGRLNQSLSISTAPESIVTSGPFVIDNVHPGQSLKLKRNPHFWKSDSSGTRLPYLDGLTLEAISDANNAMLRLNQGMIDIADRIRPGDFAALQSNKQAVQAYDLGPGLSTDHLWFNLNQAKSDGQPINPTKRAWFAESKFRRAISHAVDRETIAGKLLRGLATPLDGFVSPGNRIWKAKNLPRLDYDLNRARQLLEEAGFQFRGSSSAPELYDKRGNRVEFTLLVQAENEPRKQMATIIQQDLAKLGIAMQIAQLETQAVMERISKTYDYDAVLMGLTLTDIEPSSYESFLRSASALHQWAPKQLRPATAWESRIDELVTAQASASNLEKRQALFFEIQQIMAEHSPIIPIVSRHIVSAAHTRLSNYRPSNIFPYSLWNIEELFLKDIGARS